MKGISISMKHYLKSDFVTLYIEYLKNPSGVDNPYTDPDTEDPKYSAFDPEKGEYENVQFYHDLAAFLNHQEKKLHLKESFSYKSSGDEPSGKKRVFIIVNDSDGNEIMRLTSDQFGFSAWKSIMADKRCKDSYPLHRCIEAISKIEDSQEKESLYTFLAEYVYDTRTIGGSFIFPKVKNEKGNYCCNYNVFRGAGSYIEDRVDLTLLEIKHFYDIHRCENNDLLNLYDYHNDILHEQYTNPDSMMEKWLSHFETFENYIEFFMLEMFVRKDPSLPFPEYVPIDIFSKDLGENCLILDSSAVNGKQINRTEDINIIINMLENVRELILSRSSKIESVIK